MRCERERNRIRSLDRIVVLIPVRLPRTRTLIGNVAIGNIDGSDGSVSVVDLAGNIHPTLVVLVRNQGRQIGKRIVAMDVDGGDLEGVGRIGRSGSAIAGDEGRRDHDQNREEKFVAHGNLLSEIGLILFNPHISAK